MTRLQTCWIVLSTSLTLATAPAGAQDLLARGREVFGDQGCYGCHTVGAAGTPIGPDLSRVGFKYPRRYLEEWLRDPSAQKPTAHMPRISLSEEEISALAAFLSSLQ
jgi:mono/diheme cytochrome c family protein